MDIEHQAKATQSGSKLEKRPFIARLLIPDGGALQRPQRGTNQGVQGYG
jgi:hypothetical protein